MPIHLEAQLVPLVADDSGVIRVGETRVTLETVVGAFRQGATAEEIASQYPAVSLADIYGVIGFYLHHQREVEEYLREAQVEADQIRTRIEQQFPSEGIRDRLLARRAQRMSDPNASPGV